MASGKPLKYERRLICKPQRACDAKRRVFDIPLKERAPSALHLVVDDLGGQTMYNGQDNADQAS